MINTQYRVLPETPKYQNVALSESEKQSIRAKSLGAYGRLGTSAGLFVLLFIIVSIISFIITMILGANRVITNDGVGIAVCCFPPFIISALAASFLHSFMGKKAASQKSKAEAEIIERETKLNNQASEKELTRVNEEAHSLTLSLTELYDSSLKIQAKLFDLLDKAAKRLDVAEIEYKANAFAPFWDEVENGATCLGDFKEAANDLSRNAVKYYQKLEGKQHTFPDFPVQSQTIPDVSPILERLHRIVRMGQTNFHFANIWEHCRTRQVMIAGFRTLNEAIYNLGDALRDSVSSLQASVSSDVAALVQEQIRIRESIDQTGASVNQRLLEQNRMLDNIQHDRKPN